MKLEEVRQELRNFGEITSIKGVSRTLKSHSMVVRIFWLMALLACLSMLLYQVITLAINYCSFGITNTFLYVQSQPNFPDVTICNFIPIVNETQFDESYGTFLQRIHFIKERAPDKIKSNTDLWNYLKLIDTFNANIPFLEDLLGNAERDNLIAVARFYDWDLFEKKDCGKFPILNKPLQLCTTLRPNSSSAAAVSAVVFINDLMPTLIDSYYDWIKVPLASGVKVMIHPQGTVPDDQVSVYVPPGTSVIIDVMQNNITRLPHPYGSCSNRKQIFPGEENSPPYDQVLCISLCRQRQSIEHCGCVDNNEFFTDVELDMGNYTFCMNITQQLENAQTFVDQGILPQNFGHTLNCSWNFVPNEYICDCPLPCAEIQYNVGSSFSNWPNVHYQLAFYDVAIRNDVRYREKFLAYETLLNDSYGQSDAETLKELRKLKLIEENFLQVSVRMSQSMVQLVEDIPAVSWTTLTSNLGGSLNLWLGISILTAAEVIELIYSLIIIAVARKENKNQDTHL